MIPITFPTSLKSSTEFRRKTIEKTVHTDKIQSQCRIENNGIAIFAYFYRFSAKKQSFLQYKCVITCLGRSYHSAEKVRNAEERAHSIYGSTEESAYFKADPNAEISYRFPPSELNYIHITFNSDLNRATLPGSKSEREHSMRANRKQNAVQMHMPTTLCREFALYGEQNQKRTLILHVDDNRKRAYHIHPTDKFDTLILRPIKAWGGNGIPLISFYFG